ncbi:MAG: hypothetical protein ACH346_05690 [Chthoniobacterales bacterium]
MVFFLFALLAHATALLSFPDSESNDIRRFEVSGTIPQQSIYQKKFHPGGCFEEKNFTTKNYREPKYFSTTVYPVHSFFGLKNPWLGKKIFATEKVFSSTQLEGKIYPLSEKQNSYSRVQSFSTHAAVLNPKTQGELDYDEALQQALKKNLSPGEVRELLSKQL